MEKREEVNHLVLNRRREIINPVASSAIPIVAPIVPITVLCSDLEDFDDLVFCPDLARG